MTDKIREEIAWLIHDNYGKMPIGMLATKILSIKGIRIEAENQELPRNPEPDPPNDHDEVIAHAAYGSAQQDMLAEGWVKCEKEGK